MLTANRLAVASRSAAFPWQGVGDTKMDNLIFPALVPVEMPVGTRDGEEALDYLYCRGNFKMRTGDNPAVLLLDLKLPRVDGLEVLQQM